MRYLLIGGNGFIGPHVARPLMEQGHDVIVFHRGTHDVPLSTGEVIGDRQNLAAHERELRAAAPDVVIDLVLSSGRQARALADVFRHHTARIVALSSCDVYRACGVTHGLEEGELEPLPLTETSRLRTRPQTYPAEQLAALQQVFGWVDAEYNKIPVEREILADASLPGTVLRLPMVYGAGDPLRRFYPIVKRVLDGRTTIPISASMAAWRGTKGYVVNVGEAIALAAMSDTASRRVYNVGEPDSSTELEWAQLAADALGWNGQFTTLPDDRLPPYLRAPGNTAQQWVVDSTRIREELGYRERVNRSDAVRQTAEWERTHPPAGFSFHQFDYAAEDLIDQ